jgi:hypothetical protein
MGNGSQRSAGAGGAECPVIDHDWRDGGDPIDSSRWDSAIGLANIATVGEMRVMVRCDSAAELTDLGEERIHVDHCAPRAEVKFRQPTDTADVQQQVGGAEHLFELGPSGSVYDALLGIHIRHDRIEPSFGDHSLNDRHARRGIILPVS